MRVRMCAHVCVHAMVHARVRSCARACVCLDLLQCSLDVNALSPGGRRVRQAFAGVAPARDIDPLPPQVLEGRGHHFNTVVRQGASVLRRRNNTRRTGGRQTNDKDTARIILLEGRKVVRYGL